MLIGYELLEMWQVILGAAIAGSTSFVAKRLFNPFSRDSRLPENYAEEQEPVAPPVGIGSLDSSCDKTDGVFRFSSSGSTVNSGSGSGSSPGFCKSSGVKCRVRVRGLMKKKKKNGGGCVIEKRSGNVGAFETKSEVCSKKTKTLGAASASKRGSYYSNQGSTSTLSKTLIDFFCDSRCKNEVGMKSGLMKTHEASEISVVGLLSLA